MYEIFEQLLQKHGLTAYKVSMDTGISQSTFSTWKAKRNKLGADKLQILSKYFGVSVDYLLTGKMNDDEDKYSDENSDLLVDISRNLKDAQFKRLLSNYLKMGKKNRESLIELSDFLYNKENSSK